MPVKQFQYKTLEQLVRKNLCESEDAETKDLIKALRSAKKRGYLSKDELLEICNWKSSRAIRRIESNHAQTIKKHTRIAFSTNSEQKKIEELTSLNGVAIPMASAILMLTNPKKYGVIDVRVWEILRALGLVKTNPKGVSFRFNEWYRCLTIMRYFAQKNSVSTRDIERTIFKVHKLYQDGRLYKN